MTSLQKELSLNLENSWSNLKDLNETHLSQITKGSAEKDFKELASLINRTVREDKGNVSILSNSKFADKSNSMLSNEEIWNVNQSPDDSKNFIKNFRDIYEKKKLTNMKKKDNKILMSKKPKHLSIHTQNQKKSNFKEEDYNVDVEESIDSRKKEQINHMIMETKNNNLNEVYVANSNDCSTKKTNQDEIHSYRSSNSEENFSITPQNQANISENNNSNLTSNMFPTIPNTSRGIQISLEDNLFSFEERDANNSEKESKNMIVSNEKEILNNNLLRSIHHSTRHSTESNDSATETNMNNNNYSSRKFYTPTHQNTMLSQQYNFLHMQRELNFNNPISLTSNKFNISQNVTPNNMMKSNKNLQNLFTSNNVNSNSIAGSNLSIFSPTSIQNSNNMNNIKSLSFCANNKSPTVVKYGSVDFKPRPIIPMFSSDQKNTQKIEEQTIDCKINLEDIITGKDKRTTLMLRNIPNKYTLQNVVDEINPLFIGKYDYINLPIDYERKLNLGYAFVNFVDPMHILMFYEIYHNKKWSKYRSDKKIDLNYAEKQGKKDISCKDENTYFAEEDRKINFKKNPKLEISMKFYTFFKKIYPNSVCIVENKSGIMGNKTFYVKSLGKR